MRQSLARIWSPSTATPTTQWIVLPAEGEGAGWGSGERAVERQEKQSWQKRFTPASLSFLLALRTSVAWTLQRKWEHDEASLFPGLWLTPQGSWRSCPSELAFEDFLKSLASGQPVNQTLGFLDELCLFIHSFHQYFSRVYHVPGIVLGMTCVDLREACRVTSCPRFPRKRNFLCANQDRWSPYFGCELGMQCNFLYRV